MANAADKDLTLSSALLAPLNSLFEAQVQSARSFLSFILQLGFKENVTEQDIKTEREKLNSNQYNLDDSELKKSKQSLNELEALVKKKKRFVELKNLSNLTLVEKQELESLEKQLDEKDMKGDVWTMKFKYEDGQGIERKIEIPALALVPVQPLTIQSASFDFSMSVKTQNQTYFSKQKSRAVKGSPWEFISSKRITGQLISEKSTNQELSKAMQIHVEVGPAPIPHGLSNVLTSLTQSARIVNDTN